MKRVLFILLITIFPSVILGQSIKEIFVDVSNNGKVFSDFLKKLEKNACINGNEITKKQRASEYLNDFFGG